MGYLHEGHLSLIRESKRTCDVTIVSIFVNPTQFGPSEDFNRYPRAIEKDNKFLENEKVDYLFLPSTEEIYPKNFQTYVNVEYITKKLEGEFRPTHFRGVSTVVLILLNCVQPDYAFFGQKDAQQLAVIKQMVRDLKQLVKDYEKQIAALQKQISEKLGKQQLPSGEISVTVTSEKQGSGKLAFSYVVSNAGWYPSYDIRVDDIKNPCSIIYKANVFQNSGVDWKDVRISFSNATPWIAGDIPVLNPWFVDYYSPAPVLYKASVRSRKSEAPMAEAAVAMDKAEVLMEAPPVPVEKRIGETTVIFDVNVPTTVPSDGKMQTVEIQRLTAPASYKYVTTPKLSQLAYLTANITDWAQLNLQSGEATLYFENSFVGKSNVNVSQLTDTLALSLGTDNSIIVKREKRVDFTTRKTIGSNKTETYSFLLSIRNNKPVPIRITLNDQIPVSSNSGISVEAVELTGGRYNQQTGEVRWDLELGRQESKQVVLTYSVKYPKDKTVILE